MWLETFFVKKSNGFEETAAFSSIDQHCQAYSAIFLENDIPFKSCSRVSKDLPGK